MQSQSRAIPVLLGAAVSVAIANVLGTLNFNLTTWLLLGKGISIVEAYSKLAVNPVSALIMQSIPVVASMGGGYTAAAYSPVQPKMNALFVGVLLVAWYFVMLASPFQLMQFRTFDLFMWFAIPIPAVILGAVIRSRIGQ
jgi:hypothetical protein